MAERDTDYVPVSGPVTDRGLSNEIVVRQAFRALGFLQGRASPSLTSAEYSGNVCPILLALQRLASAEDGK